MADFTPVTSAIGGLLVGAAAALMLGANGRIAGISGILGGALTERGQERGWRATFVLGLLGGGLLCHWWIPERFATTPASLPGAALAGVLVGVGTRLGSGCTSGHGVCGISRGSGRSVTATAVFIGAGALTVFAVRHLLVGAS